ncbi:MAG: hypothetical protein OEU93_08990 [Rubrivivax sp.]|nr:hypothetical protein [Rubrivivax sp.]MDH5339856.1 hypothetical protein [Rubrivivax sp.]
MKNPFARQPPRPRPRRRPDPPPEEDATPAACGWFDSSHALRQGLQVREVRAADELAASVPLGWWLDWALAPADAPPACAGGRAGGPTSG